MKMYASKSKKIDQKGSSLIEVMVALFVLAIGLLGILSMQVKSMQYSQSAFHYNKAMHLANNILENIRSNTALDFSDYYVASSTTLSEPTKDCNGVGVVCTPTEMKNHDLYLWRENIKSALVSGNSSISVTTNGDVAIKVFFDDTRSNSMDDTSTALSEYVLVTGF